MATYLAECIEYLVEVNQDLSFGNLGDVVHGLAGVVTNSGILISEACQNGRHNDLEVPSKFLEHDTQG
jgi:hypothetical protein